MADLVSCLRHFLLRHHLVKAPLAVGLSGGVDSVVLLFCLLRAREGTKGLLAVHVHHGLLPEADAWADFCAQLCHSWQVPFSLNRLLPPPCLSGFEAWARQRRLEIFSSLPAQAVLLGHHADDLAETVLFRLARGTGTKGISAMAEMREMPQKGLFGPCLARPFLHVPRAGILAFAKENALSWIEDQSNFDKRFSRNFLRHEVLPLLQSRFPQASASLAKAARHACETQALLDEIAGEDLKLVALESGSLDRPAFLRLSAQRQKNLLRFWIGAKGAPLPSEAVLEELLSRIEEGQGEVILGEDAARVDEGGIYRLSRQTPFSRTWQGEKEMAFPGGLLTFLEERETARDRHVIKEPGLDLGRLRQGKLIIRPRLGGEKLLLDERRPPQRVKELLRLAKIPPALRRDYPLLWVEGDLVAVPGVAVAASWRAPLGGPALKVFLRSTQG